MITLNIFLLGLNLIFISYIAYCIKFKDMYIYYIEWYKKTSIMFLTLIINVMLLLSNNYCNNIIIFIINIILLLVGIVYSLYFIMKIK